VESLSKDSDISAVDAAAKEAMAKALEAAVVNYPSASRIEEAVQARVKADIARAIASAQAESLSKAQKAADDARVKADAERLAEAASEELRAWVRLCRWIGLAGVAIGALLGGVLGYFAGPRTGIPIGGLIAGTGMVVVAFGATITWLPLVLGAVVVIGVVAWILSHQRTLRVGFEASRTIDAIEGAADMTAVKAKAELSRALKRSGLEARFAKVRSRWKAISLINPMRQDDHG
jgi:hypothetical protein